MNLDQTITEVRRSRRCLPMNLNLFQRCARVDGIEADPEDIVNRRMGALHMHICTMKVYNLADNGTEWRRHYVPAGGRGLTREGRRPYRRCDQISLRVLEAADVSIAKHCRMMSVITPTSPTLFFFFIRKGCTVGHLGTTSEAELLFVGHSVSRGVTRASRANDTLTVN